MGIPAGQVATDDRLRELQDYWLGCCRGRRMPSRADIDPCAVPSLLPWLVLADIGATSSDIRFRLVGTEVVHRFGQEFTGRYLADLDLGDSAAALAACFVRTARTGKPQGCRCECWTGDFRLLRFNCLLLPLSTDGCRVDKILGAVLPG